MVVSTLKQPSLQKKSSPSSEESNLKEWLKCRRDLKYFAQTYCYLQDRAKRQTVKFEPWPHLMSYFDMLMQHKLWWIGKARQLGFSWASCIFALWLCKFNESAKGLLLSQNEDYAWDLIEKCAFIDSRLPDWMYERRNPDSRSEIGWESTGSVIKALPSTEKAGRSTDASFVMADEFEYHEFAEQNFAALKPTIDAGGWFIGLSTGDPLKLNSFFKTRYLEAKSGDSQFKSAFFGWNVRPERNREWYNEVTRDLSEAQKQGEYPETEDDFLAVVKTRKFFDLMAMEEMKQNKRNPIDCDLSRKYQGLVSIYRLPVVGEKYLVATDPSDGKSDPHAIVVMDKFGEEMACSHGKTPADMCAQIHDDLVRYYGNALNTYELNARAGGLFSEKLKTLDTPNQAKFISPNGEIQAGEKRTGWSTTKHLWDTLIWKLEEAVRLRRITIHTPSCLDEFSYFIVPEGQEPQKARGGHDDFIDAWARVWFLRRYLKFGKSKAVSMTYKESM